VARIPVAGPWITDKEVAYVADAARHAWYAEANAWHQRFERAFAQHLGLRHAVALPSCTAALHLALLALGVGPGDEVIVPDLTWIATAAPISYVGATPVFADVDPATWCLSAETLAACVTPRTRAVIPVDLYGGLPDMAPLLALAEHHGLALIEDAAEAVGAEQGGRRAGTFGRVGVFSFHGSKTLTTGEGGLLASNDDDLVARVQVLRDHGRRPGDRAFFNAEVGHKYKMSALQAALGLAQLERLDELLARKDDIFGWYRARLVGVPGLTLNPERPGTRATWWMVTVLVDPSYGLDKDALQERLDARGIDSRPFFRPLSSLPAYAGSPEAERARARNRAAYALSPWGLNLPSALSLTEADVDGVCRALLEILGRA
jgi:perosamine synthetase